MIRRVKVLMVTAIGAATLLSLAAILPAAATSISLADLTTLPIVVAVPDQPTTLEMDPPTDKEPTVTVNPGSVPAAKVIPPPGD